MERIEEPKPAQRRVVTSAPVSRNGSPGDYTPGPDRVKLSAEERDFARKSGLSEQEYATSKVEVGGAKQGGMYNE